MTPVSLLSGSRSIGLRLAAPARAARPHQILARRTNTRNTPYTFLPGGHKLLAPQNWLRRGIIKYLWIGIPFSSVFVWIHYYNYRFG